MQHAHCACPQRLRTLLPGVVGVLVDTGAHKSARSGVVGDDSAASNVCCGTANGNDAATPVSADGVADAVLVTDSVCVADWVRVRDAGSVIVLDGVPDNDAVRVGVDV